MLSSPIRLQRLSDLQILDTPADAHFDAITRLTAHVMRAPRAFINFVDDARTWCKSAWGAARESRRHADSLCALAVQEENDVVVFDIAQHHMIKNHPEFCGDAAIVFYMAIVLRSTDGFALGTLCIKDTLVRNLTQHEIEAFRLLGEQVALLLEKLVEKQLTIDAAQRNRDQFLAMLAHELRAPMSPILTAVQVLNKFQVSVDQRDWAKQLIGRHVRHMGQLVDHLLSTSMVSLGAVELHLEAARVNDLLDQALEMAESLITRKGHRLTRTVVDDVWVMADRVQCPLILVNLIGNAARYTPEHGQIDILVEGDGDMVRIEVTDTGVGIAREDREEIFQVFGQTLRTLDRASGGMGLGLPLASRLAHWHGGSLKVHSDGVGQGSKFTLVLKQSPPKGDLAPDDHVGGAFLRPLDIVVIDDNADTADALAMYCEMSGHTVRTAYRSINALRMVSVRQPDVVLSDIGLPEIDGYTLVGKMRALTANRRTKFVAITGYGSDKDRLQAFDAGFDEHFAKPVDFAKLDLLLGTIDTRNAT